MDTLEIKKDYDLTKLNTFGVPARAKLFVEIENELQLKKLFDLREFQENERLFLGGGSNIVFTKDFDGIVIQNKLKGIQVLHDDDGSVTIRSMSGESWHDLVSFATEHNYWGIENLALIPGTVGAAPVQNIGAYGAELKHVVQNVEVYLLSDEVGAKKNINP